MLKFFISFLFITLVASQEFKVHSKKGPVKPFNPNDLKPFQRGSRVIGGKAATDGQFPFVNEINQHYDGYYVLCTGTFITTSWSITCRHCLKTEGDDWAPAYVLYGSAARNSPIRKTLGVDSYVWWTDPNHLTDIAVVHTHSPVELNQFVGLAQLPPLSMENSHYEGLTVTHAGYGAFKDLQYQQLKIQYISSGCLDLNGYNDYWAICLKPVENTNAEGGDSGSSIFFYENGKPTIVGILWGGAGTNIFAMRTSSFIRSISDTVGIPYRP